MENPTDIGEAMMQRFRTGDDAAFAELYRLYSRKIWAVCERVLLDRFAADDVTQDVFIKVWTHHQQYSLGRPLWPWLRTITMRSCLDWLRSSDRVKDHGFDALVDSIQEGEWPAVPLWTQIEATDPVEWRDLREAFAGCWQGLTDTQRFTLQCVDWSDVKGTWRLLSERTAKEPPAVRMAVLRAGRALVTCVLKKGFHPTHSDFLSLIEKERGTEQL